MFDVLIGAHIFGLAIIIYSLFIMFRGESTYAQKLVIYFMLAEFVQNMGYLQELCARTMNEALIAVRIEYIGSSLVVIFFMMFIRRYCGLEERVVLERVLLLGAFSVVIMVWTTPSHQLFYREIGFVDTGVFPHLELVYGPGFLVHTVVAVVIPWFMVVHALLKTLIKEKELSRRSKIIWIILGAFVAFVIFLAYIMGFFPSGYDPTSLSLALMLSLMVIFIWNKKDYNLARAAANTVLNSLGDCMLTLDEHYKVLIYNNAAKELFPSIKVYQPIEQIDSFPIRFVEGEQQYEFEMGDRHYEAHIRTLEDFEQMVRGYTVLITDVTDTYRHIQELNDMRVKAEAANRAKSDFLANMSHEIRTPMNAVVGMSELIIEESRGRKMYEYACDIKSAALNLLSIINGILDLSKVEAGKMELVEEPYYTQVLVQETVNLVRMVAVQKGLQMRVHVSDDIPCQLKGDEGRIRQVLINILNNAIKFTAKGYVKLSVFCGEIDDETICLEFRIEDTGIGMKQEDLQYVFESFRQLDMNKNRKIEGTGLGLSITEKLVKLMKGNISVESVYGEGTTFVVRIPQVVLNRKTVKEEPKIKSTKADMNPRWFRCEKCRVLVVDDNLINRKVAISMLKAYGMQIHEAGSGVAAIEMVKNNTYDMIFMDHMMPELDGVETTKRILEECRDTIQDTVIIALTANAIQGAKEMYLQNGFKDFLSKPFERAQLHEILLRWVPEQYKEYTSDDLPEDKMSEMELADIYMAGVNVRKVVRENDYSIEQYMRLLSEFWEKGNDQKNRVGKMIYDKDYDGYQTFLNRLKSDAFKIGALKLSCEAESHKDAVAKKNFHFVDTQFVQLLSDYITLLQEIERVLKKKKYGFFAFDDVQ